MRLSVQNVISTQTVAASPALRIRAGIGRPSFGRRFDRTIERGQPAVLERGVFVFSLDFELAVAAWDSQVLYHALRPRIEQTRQAIVKLLALLERYNVSATWATVGHLFRTPGPLDIDVDDWAVREIPSDQLFAPDMLDAIQACKVRQDIGCHTYRHINAAAAELSDDIVDDDLRQCASLAVARELKLRSFIFPFNCVGRLELLARYGYTSFRGSNSEWYTRGFGGRHRVFKLVRSALKGVDDLLALPPPVDRPERVAHGLWMIPHSMLYRGGGPDARFLPVGRQVRKAERGLDRAVQRKGVFHLWTHPQNLGLGTEAALAGLERIFAQADECRRRGELDILSMADLADRLNTTAYADSGD